MATLRPGDGVGAPIATANPDHQPRVPTEAGVPPYCSCGVVGGNGTDRPLLADHLREMDPTYGGSDMPVVNKSWLDMTPEEREIQQALIVYRALMASTNPHVLPDDVKAVIADGALKRVEQEVVSTYMIETRNMHRTITWLVDHLDECHHAELDRGPDRSNLLITTLDDVQQWLEDMSGVLGAEGYDGDELSDES